MADAVAGGAPGSVPAAPPAAEDEASRWRARIRQIGRAAFIREEMERLGFWKPDPQAERELAGVLAQLRVRNEELAELRAALGEVDRQITDAQDVALLLAEIRRRRIERVQAAREERRATREQARTARREQDRERRLRTPPHLGRGVSAGLRYTGGDRIRVEMLGLPWLETAADVATAIAVEPGELAWLTYHRGAALVDHYHRFTIPKRSGGVRVISSPKSRLRVAQTWLLEAVLAHLPVHDAAMAFRSARSIVHNAAAHVGKALVVRLDLKDFFPSIGFRRVKGLFESFGYNEGVATILALLATEAPRVAATLDGERRFVGIGGRQLPQGACTSPALTNVLCRRLDARLAGAAGRYGFAYTRYADDLVFSHADGDASLGALLAAARRILQEEGFTVNEEKTAVMRPQHRQAVTGLVVNGSIAPIGSLANGSTRPAGSDGPGAAGQPRVSRDDVRRFRAFLHQCETLGLEEMTRRLGRNAQAYAGGYLSFLHMVSPRRAEQVRLAHPWLVPYHRLRE